LFLIHFGSGIRPQNTLDHAASKIYDLEYYVIKKKQKLLPFNKTDHSVIPIKINNSFLNLYKIKMF